MIIIVAENYIKQGKVEEFKTMAQELIRESRKERGCLSYNLYEDIHNGNKLTFIEEWKDEDAINNHNKAIHFTTLVPKLAQFKEVQTEASLYRKTSY